MTDTSSDRASGRHRRDGSGPTGKDETAGAPAPDPTSTDHPTGDDQAAANRENEPPG